MSGIKINNVSRHFGSSVALDHVNLEVQDGEFFSLLGPSGCGKTTLLNIISGFLEPTTGSVGIGGKDVTNLPPYRRNLGMVFQNYALFPHLSVFENVAYGLTIKKMSKSEIKKRVMECLSLVQLEKFVNRRPHQLSGGQQQRVAIARALAIQPTVLLLDEPLSNLDAKLRKEMQTELRSLQQRIGITTVLVTHDQEEALSLSDRVGILGNGHLQQVGTPLEVYRQPSNRFVAEFIGQVNLTTAEILPNSGTIPNGCVAFQSADWKNENGTPLKLAVPANTDLQKGSSALFMLRPERIHVGTKTEGDSFNQARVVVKNVTYIGNSLRLTVTLFGGGELLLHVPDPLFSVPPEQGQELQISWEPEDLVPLLGEEKGL